MSGRPLKVGVQLPEVEREVRWPELLDMIRAIEDLGCDSIWLGEHLLYRWAERPARGPWEAWTEMAAIAAVTSRVEFGPLVACTNFHNPALLAKQASTIDEISGGRFVLGLGAGWNQTDFSAFGLPYDHRVDRFEEAFTIIRTLLHDGAIDFDGRFYQARDCELLPRGPRPNGPPLLIGSNGPRMLRITMPYADAWNTWFSDLGNEAAGVARLRAIVDDACVDVGRDPAEVARTCALLVGFDGATGRVSGDAGEAAMGAIQGSPEEMAETLRGFAREGISHVQLVMDPITVTSIRTFARGPPGAGSSLKSATGGAARWCVCAPPVGHSSGVRACEPRASIPTAMRDSNRSAHRGRGRLVASLAFVSLVVAGCGGAPVTATLTPSSAPLAAPTPTPDPHRSDPVSANDIFRALQAAKLDVSAYTAGTGPKGEPVTTINGAYDGWPIIVSEYSSAKALAKANKWKAGAKLRQGDPPVSIKGLNILIEWGPMTGRRPPKLNAEQRAAVAALIETIDPLLYPLKVRSNITIEVPQHTPVPSPSPSPSQTPSASSSSP